MHPHTSRAIIWLACALSLFARDVPAGIARAVTAGDAPPAPDYSRSTSWAAWPGRAGGADVIPAGAGNHGGARVTAAASAATTGGRATADVFFIHPTTYLSDRTSNARYDEAGQTSELIERSVLRFQASAFNGCCRQAALKAFFQKDDTADATALDLAYDDVQRAFDYYIEHENHGRPFILAGHSQGSLHALRLLQERIAGTPLQRRLVAAYIVGYEVPSAISAAGVPICETRTQTGCVISWNTVKPGAVESAHRGTRLVWLDGRYQRVGNQRIVCINPLDWSADSNADATLNLGSLPGVRPAEQLRPLETALTGARCVEGDLTVDIPFSRRRGFADMLTLFGSYHIYDYSLFYANIRENAEERVAAYLARAQRP
ncbi:MAG TPA: DUF3089 domain-containing protein [Steroidobacteraceae bacterium]|jgi:hypothetical protein|nr:DUF3089 domain-containing protein [Steroidobacteraceae bacterium]